MRQELRLRTVGRAAWRGRRGLLPRNDSGHQERHPEREAEKGRREEIERNRFEKYKTDSERCKRADVACAWMSAGNVTITHASGAGFFAVTGTVLVA